MFSKLVGQLPSVPGLLFLFMRKLDGYWPAGRQRWLLKNSLHSVRLVTEFTARIVLGQKVKAISE